MQVAALPVSELCIYEICSEPARLEPLFESLTEIGIDGV
jgi:hypothetical protein